GSGPVEVGSWGWDHVVETALGRPDPVDQRAVGGRGPLWIIQRTGIPASRQQVGGDGSELRPRADRPAARHRGVRLMCGIAGILRFDPRDPVDEARLRRMIAVLRHRGPDGEGLLMDGSVGLAHRRLSIVDVPAGHQPMANEDDRIWITFNGEIYNHATLRPGLEAAGHRYRNRSDTETILHLYEEMGERCVERLQGMFAF